MSTSNEVKWKFLAKENSSLDPSGTPSQRHHLTETGMKKSGVDEGKKKIRNYSSRKIGYKYVDKSAGANIWSP